MSAEVDIIGHQARSREGRGLSLRSGDSDKWIDIQKNTFMNWVNLQLQGSGHQVEDFETDFDNGVKLCALVEALQNRKIGKVIKKPMNQHQSLENVTLALRAIAEDNVRLVNIGSEDIVNGSQKLILGLIWHLILRYQIGKTKFPPKKLMLAWLQAVIPECRIGNFTSDWNDGVALSALIDYCQPGLFSQWKSLSRQNRLENCTNAMNIAHQHLNIPMVVRPEDLASPHLDDLSGMTYLSYYMMPDSPGFYATRREIRKILQAGTCDNFTTDWNDGHLLCSLTDWNDGHLLCNLVKSVGGEVQGWPALTNDPVDNLQRGLDGGKRLGIEPIIKASEMADHEVEHLGVMAYAAYYTKLKPVKIAAKPPVFSGNLDNAYVGKEIKREVKVEVETMAEEEEKRRQTVVTRETEIVVEKARGQSYDFEEMVALNDGDDSPMSEGIDSPGSDPEDSPDAVIRTVFEGTFDDVMCYVKKTFQIHLEGGSPDDIRAVLTGPNSSPPVHMQWSGSTATCSFSPTETGQHKLDVLCDGKSIVGCPVHFKVNADRSRITCRPPDRACVGVDTDVMVDISQAGQGDLRVEARSPSGRLQTVPALYRSGAYDAGFCPDEVGTYTASFCPDEVGVWEVSVLYEGEHINGSPYRVPVFDPNLVRVYGLEGGAVGRAFTFNADAAQAGEGDVTVKVSYHGSEIPSYINKNGTGEHQVDFNPQGPGSYLVNVYMNNREVRGSPYSLEIVDSSQVTLSGQGLSLVPVDLPTTFSIHTKGASSDNISVNITAPSGKRIQSKLRQVDRETAEVEYLPVEAGDHSVSVEFFGQAVKGSPFISKAYNTGQLLVTDMPSYCLPGNPVSFDIDASKAGSGNIEIRVNGGRVACSVQNKGNHCFTASFVPEHSHHLVEMTFNEQEIDGSPWKIPLIDLESIRMTTSSKEIVPVNIPSSFTVHCAHCPLDQLDISVKDPQGMHLPFEKTTEKDGNLLVTYTPREVGDHVISVQCLSQEVNGSPITAKAYNAGAITVTSLDDGFVGHPMDFVIDVHAAGEGQLQIMVNNGNLPNEVEAVDTGVYRIRFVPVDPGTQQVDIFFNDEALSVSPLACQARGLEAEVRGMTELVAVRSESVFTLKSSNGTKMAYEVTILCPNGQNVPYKMTGHGSPALTVEYLPREVGTYTVNAILAGRPIKGSPFKVKTYDPSKVKVSKISEGIVGVPNKFTVDASSAGEGTMEITISANGHNIPNQAHAIGTGKYEVSFVGREAVTHDAAITYNGHHVPGSPFSVDFVDASQITASGEGLSLVANHRHTEFLVHTPAANLKDLTSEVTGPDGRSIPVHLHDAGNGTYKVDWVPNSVGDHRVQVAYAGVPIAGSPYTVQVYDASKVTVSTIGQAFVGKPLSFTLDASKAGDGNLEIHVTADGESVPNYVRQERDAIFKVTFTPQRPTRHKINVTFNGEGVPGSPFTCVAMDTDSLALTGEGLHSAPANIATTFKVDPKGAGDFDLRAWVVSPHGHDIPVRITGNPHSAYRVDYTPVDVGHHKVYVEYGGVEVRGSPFDVDVFDPALVRVNSNGRAYLSKPFSMYLDTSVAGKGKLQAEVKSRGSQVPCQLRDVGGGRHELTFMSRDINTHLVNVTYNGVPLPGVPYHVDVIDSSSVSASGEGLHTAKVYREAWFNLDLHGMDPSDLDVDITGPSGSRVPCGINRKGHISRVEFTPVEPGLHNIEVMFAGSRIHGSPFTCHAYDPSRVRITDVDRTAKKEEREIGFIVDTSAAGMGELEAMITHHGHKVHTQRQSLGDGKFRYTFFPGESGHYKVKATFNDDNVPGSPLIINVEDETPTFITISFRGVEPMNVRSDSKNYFMLHTDGNKIDKELLDVNIEAPTGEQLDSSLVENTDGDYRVEWTPEEPGRHSVDVLFAGQRVKGSPFFIEVFDVTKIRVDNFFNGNVGEQAGFSVDTSRAGKCEQTVRVVSPTGRGIPVNISETSAYSYNVIYEPSESGQHRIFLTYNSLELPGSPFTQEIGEGLLPPAHGDGLHRGEEDKAATFFIDTRGMAGEPFVQVDGPNSIAKCSIESQPDGQYMVTYIPVEVGMFDVMVKYNGKELPGSPYHPKVVCARKVLVVGGWQHYMDNRERVHLMVNEEKTIPFDVSDAGPGKMTAEVKSPSGLIPVTVDDSTVGRSTVIFTPREEGIHSIYLYWSDTPLTSSPFQGYATGGVLDPTKVILTGRGLKEAIVQEEAEFIIDASHAGHGDPEVQLTGVRAEVSVFVTPLGGGKFRCTYIPVVPGAYLLHISWNGRQLRGSPYKVNIMGAFYPNKVVVSGEGLKGGLLGRDFDIRIDTRKAGPGELTAYCVGPSKVAHCELEDHHDGTFRLIVRPQESGRHVLQVKYGGDHVLGSPFDFKVSAQPDASKVRVSGPGVEHGILATFQSRFVVETRGAGAGQLTVRIRGPKGAFQVEMYRDSQKDRTILCRYDPVETGLYIISIRWSGVDVPGSPFHIHILDTQSELEQVLADQSFHNASFHSSRAASGYGQWREEF
ncbi:hypothetical protein ACOMHN_006742 [Nucella lapillus]